MWSLLSVFQKWREGFGYGFLSNILRDVKKIDADELDYRRRRKPENVQSAEDYNRQELYWPFFCFLMTEFADATLQVLRLIKLLPVYLVTNSVDV